MFKPGPLSNANGSEENLSVIKKRTVPSGATSSVYAHKKDIVEYVYIYMYVLYVFILYIRIRIRYTYFRNHLARLRIYSSTET